LASPAGDCFTGSKGTRLLFGDEVSFAQWGSLGYTWALKGQPPVVKTTGKRKGYKVLGLIELFSGRFFYHGQEERFDSERYQAFLAQVLAQTTEHPTPTPRYVALRPTFHENCGVTI
jgi:hypothetical protein